MKKQAKRIFWNAMLLTAASLLMRTVAVAFQVTLSNRVGAEAMGLFSLMSGVYGFALTLATSGIHLGVTRLVVDAVGTNRPERVPPAMKRAALYAASFGCTAALLLSFGADWIGTEWLRDARTIPSLRLFGITLPLISLSSAWSGYFSAVRRVYKNALVQVWEQLIKITVTMYLLSAIIPGDVSVTCCTLVLGGVIAEVCSFLPEWILYLTDRCRHFTQSDRTAGREEGKKLIRISLPIAMTTYLRSGLVTLEHILIPEGLRNSGVSHADALASYGRIHSMALPVILYPAALISSFSGLLVPELAEGAVQNGSRRIRYMISRVWWLSLLFSIGVSGILICFSGEIGKALYPGTDTGTFIRLLAPLIPIMYVDTATDAMMKGLGEQIFSMNINIADALISVVLVWLLIPRLGITGYLITIYFSEFFNTTVSITHLLCVSQTPVRLSKWVYKPLLSIVGATCIGNLILQSVPFRTFSPALSVCVHIGTVFALYIGLLLLTGCVDRDDRSWFATLFLRETPPQKRNR